jgi:WD40 repeat protein
MRSVTCYLLMVPLAFATGTAGAPAAPQRARDALEAPLPRFAIARLGTGRFRLGVDSANVILLPDGKTLATVGADSYPQRIILLDAVSGREVSRCDIFSKGSNGSQFTPDGKELIDCCSATLSFDFHDLSTGKKTRHIDTGIRNAVFALSADTRLLATSSKPGFGRKSPVLVFEVKTGKQLSQLEPGYTEQLELALSPDGKWLAAWGAGGDNRAERMRIARTIELYDPTPGKLIKKIDAGDNETVSGVAFSRDKKTLALATLTGAVQLHDIAAGKRLKSWRATKTGENVYLDFSPDGKTLIVGNRSDTPPSAWDVASGRRLRQADSPPCRFLGVGFPGKGQVLAWGIRFETLIVWDLITGKQFTPTDSHLAPVDALVFHGEERIRTAGSDQRILEWDPTGKLVRQIAQPHVRWEYVFSPRGRSRVLRDVRTGKDLCTVPLLWRQGFAQPGPAFSTDGKLLACVSTNQEHNAVLLVLRADTGARVLSRDFGQSSLMALAFDPTGKRLGVVSGPSASRDCCVRLWRLDGKGEDPDFWPFNLQAPTCVETTLSFSPDGAQLAVRDEQGVHLLSARTGKQLKSFRGERVSLGPIFAPDNRSVAVVTDHNGDRPALALWETSSGKKRWSVELPSRATALAFSPSGQVLATGHADSTALLWDVSGRLTERAVNDADKVSELWKELASGDAEKAFAAQRRLVASGDRGVAGLGRHVRPAGGKALDSASLAQLVKQLDADEFRVRAKAFDALAAQGKAAEMFLRKSLENKPSLEVSMRIKKLLARLEGQSLTDQERQSARAVEVLEWLGSPAARQLLRKLADGRAGAAVTGEAQAALARLQQRRSVDSPSAP